MFARAVVRRISTNGILCSAFHSSPANLALTQQQMDIVKSTAPVLEVHGVVIATHFYKRILASHPELENIFNLVNQSTGAQSSALTRTICAYASNIDNLGALSSAVSRIANKHASLGITADQYPIVGEHLLASIKEVLGDAVDEQILEAWGVAYQQLANIFIGYEKGLYEKAASMPGGWNGWRTFKLAHKIRESDEITSFYLTPSDKKALPAFKPGQFVSIRCYVPELRVYQPRQYSLSDAPNGEHFRISVKKESSGKGKPAGRISNVLHESITEGSLLEVSMPFGDFTLDVNATTPVVLVSGGVGLTPMMSMLKTLVEQGKSRPVLFVHAVRSRQVHAMNSVLSEIVSKCSNVNRAIFYEEVKEGDIKGLDYDFVGRMDLKAIKDKVLLQNADYYLCGPVLFMQVQRQDLESLGVSPERIHSEVFGPSS